MKIARIVYALALVAGLFVPGLWSCSSPVPEGRYVVEGRMKGVDRTVRLLTDKFALVDTSEVVRGRFRFEGEASEPKLLFLVQPGTAEPMIAGVFVEGGGRIKICGTVAEGDERRVKVTGTEINETFYRVMDGVRRITESDEYTAEQGAQRDSAVLALVEPEILRHCGDIMGEILLGNVSKLYSPQRILELLEMFPRERRDSSFQLLSLEARARMALAKDAEE